MTNQQYINYYFIFIESSTYQYTKVKRILFEWIEIEIDILITNMYSTCMMY